MAGKRLAISKWFIKPGNLTQPGNAAAKIDGVPPDNRTVHIKVPYLGKVSRTAEAGNELASGGYAIPNGLLFSVKNYPDVEQPREIDPFQELREACRALENQQSRAAVPPQSISTRGKTSRGEVWVFAVAVIILAVVLGGVFFFSGRSSQQNTSTQATVYSKPPITLNDKDAANTTLSSILSQADAARNKQDYKTALALYRKAADAGSPIGMYRLGDLYGMSDEAEERRKSIGWYRKAAKLGSIAAMARVAVYDSDDNLLRKAAEMGDGNSMCLIGSSYLSGGNGYPKDMNQGVNWYRKGAEAGSTLCMDSLGNIYLGGRDGVPKDTAEAIRWFRRAVASAQTDPDDIARSGDSARESLKQLGVPIQ